MLAELNGKKQTEKCTSSGMQNAKNCLICLGFAISGSDNTVEVITLNNSLKALKNYSQ